MFSSLSSTDFYLAQWRKAELLPKQHFLSDVKALDVTAEIQLEEL